MNPIELIENKDPEDITDEDLDFLRSTIRMTDPSALELQACHRKIVGKPHKWYRR